MGYPRWQHAPNVAPPERDRTGDGPLPDPGARRVYRLRLAPAAVADDLSSALDDEQLAAVRDGSGRALVLAAAGSGKTRVIVHRLAHVARTGTPASAIVLATFTRRAAREMIGRAGELAGVDLAGALAGTFHAIGYRILREHGAAVGVGPTVSVLGAEDQADLVGLCRDEVLAGRDRRQSLPSPDALARDIGLALELERDPVEVMCERNPRLADRWDALAEIAGRYEERKRRLGLLDYADLLVLTDRLLASDSGRTVAAGCGAVLVDEYHDTSPLQARIAERLAAASGNLMAVGDPDQAIYGWRGADAEAVARFAEHPDTRVFPLQGNYRSTPEVVALAQAVLPGQNRFRRTLRPTRAATGLVPVIAHCTSVEEEAAFVTQRIADLMNEGRAPGEIGVLYRAHHHSVDLQLALASAGVEFELYSGTRLVESAHVRDVVAVMRARHNPADELAWRRMLGMFEGVGPRTIARVLDAIASVQAPLDALAPEDGRRAAATRESAAQLAALLSLDRPEAIISGVNGSEWFRRHLERRHANWHERQDDLVRLAELGSRAESLEAFLADLQLAERVEIDDDRSGPAKRVALTTVHQAKGLEWPVVFVLQVEPGSFPSGWSLAEGNREEEERLFYVAVTRSRDELYLCRPIAARRPWDSGASRIVLNAGDGFLDRPLPGLVEEWSVRR